MKQYVFFQLVMTFLCEYRVGCIQSAMCKDGPIVQDVLLAYTPSNFISPSFSSPRKDWIGREVGTIPFIDHYGECEVGRQQDQKTIGCYKTVFVCLYSTISCWHHAGCDHKRLIVGNGGFNHVPFTHLQKKLYIKCWRCNEGNKNSGSNVCHCEGTKRLFLFPLSGKSDHIFIQCETS